MKDKIHVLLTGGGAPGAPGIIECLLQRDDLIVHTCDVRAHAAGRYLAPHFHEVPPAHDEAFIPRVLQLCLKEGISYIIPIVTAELFHFARARRQFEEKGIQVLCNSYETLQQVNDKGNLYRELHAHGITVPDFEVVKTAAAFEQAILRLGYPQKAVCFKPTLSNGSRGFRVLDKSKDRFELLFREKPNHTFIQAEEIISLLKANEEKMPPLLVSEYLPGPEYTVDCLCDHGTPLLVIPRKRLRMNNGISIEGTVERNEEIIAYTESIIKAFSLHGNIGVQVKESADHQYKILEINPRLQGTTVALLGAGINMPGLGMDLALHQPIRSTMNDVRWGISFVRYWKELFYHS